MNGRLTSVCVVLDSSILAFSAASLRRCKASRSLAQIDAGLLAKLVRQIIHNALVEILAAEEGVAVGRLDLEHAVTHLQNGDVERAAAEIVDGDFAAPFLVQTVSQRSGRGLVDDAKHVEPGNAACVLGRLTLGVVEIGGNRDDRLFDLLSEIGLPRSPSFL